MAQVPSGKLTIIKEINFIEVCEKFPVPEKAYKVSRTKENINDRPDDQNPGTLPDGLFNKPEMLLFLHKLKWLCKKAIKKDENLLIDPD